MPDFHKKVQFFHLALIFLGFAIYYYGPDIEIEFGPMLRDWLATKGRDYSGTFLYNASIGIGTILVIYGVVFAYLDWSKNKDKNKR